MKNLKSHIIIAGLILGVAVASFIPFVNASRSSGGTYSLPAGNPVSIGAVISSTTHNNTMNDIKTEITDSLSRSGYGGMLAALRGVNGSKVAPSLSFTSDTDTGLYRAGAGDMRATVDDTDVIQCVAARVTVPVGLTVTETTANGIAVQATGNGTAEGGYFTGGSTSGTGALGLGGAPNGKGGYFAATGSGNGAVGIGGATNGTYGGEFTSAASTGYGLKATGTATGWGGEFIGGATDNSIGMKSTCGATNCGGGDFIGKGTGNGLTVTVSGSGNGNGIVATGGGASGIGGNFTGGTPNGNGVQGAGAGTGIGGQFAAGTASTATDPTVALRLSNGMVHFNGVTDPNSDESFQDTLTPINLIKVAAQFNSNAGTPTTNAGFNLNASKVTRQSATVYRVVYGQPMAAANHMAVATMNSTVAEFCIASTTTTYADVVCFDAGGVPVDLDANNRFISFMAVGAN